MSRTCRLDWPGFSGPASFELTEEALILSLEGQATQVWRVGEIRSLDWDDTSVTVGTAAGRALLSRLGADAGTLLSTLRASWPTARAAALRLAGSHVPVRFAGTVITPGAPHATAADLLLYDEQLLVAPRGRDLEPLSLSAAREIVEDADAWSVEARLWSGGAWTFARLGGDTERFCRALRAARDRLAVAAAAQLAAALPGLGPEQRTPLAASWLPGRFLPLAELTALAPRVVEAVRGGWLARSPRRRAGELLLALKGASGVLLGYTPPGAFGSTGGSEESASDGVAPTWADSAVAEAWGAASPAGDELMPDLWLLVRVSGGWLLENASTQGVATYHFRGGDELPALAELLLAAPQFSREALYEPLDMLTGERASLAIAARDLEPLARLRAAFTSRVIHRDVASWSAAVRVLAAAPVAAG